MKIAHICLSIGKGGAEKLLVDNLPYYLAKGHEVTIIQLSTIVEEPSYINSILKSGGNVISLSRGRFLNPMNFFRLLRLMKANNYDILHVHLFPTFYFASLATRFIKRYPVLIFTEHTPVNNRMSKKILQPLEYFIYKKFDFIVTVSDNVGSVLKKWLPGLTKKIKTINNGVDIEKFRSAKPYDNKYFENNFGLRENDIKLLMISRFSPPKDQDTIVKAMTLLPQNIHVFFAGDGDQMDKVKEHAKRLNVSNRTHFLGFRTDVDQLLKSADVNILSSLYEGFSGATLEALACGNPFLGADVSGINDIVPNKSFLFKKQDPKDLANKILSIVNDQALKQKMMREASEHIKQFDIPKMVNSYIELYEELLKNHNSDR